jgi:hypothetical protein
MHKQTIDKGSKDACWPIVDLHLLGRRGLGAKSVTRRNARVGHLDALFAG